MATAALRLFGHLLGLAFIFAFVVAAFVAADYFKIDKIVTSTGLICASIFLAAESFSDHIATISESSVLTLIELRKLTTRHWSSDDDSSGEDEDDPDDENT